MEDTVHYETLLTSNLPSRADGSDKVQREPSRGAAEIVVERNTEILDTLRFLNVTLDYFFRVGIP